MKNKLLAHSFFVISSAVFSCAWAAEAVPPVAESGQAAVLRFSIERYVVEGATLISQSEIDAAVAPFVGSDKDFSDVQHALEAIEDVYSAHGLSAVRVLLPEQELEQGTVHFRVVESRIGSVKVQDNQFVSESNALNAIPSVRSGAAPRAKQIARELKLANENPARQLNVVLKAGEKEDEVDANVVVTDSKPTSWGAIADNTGTPETGRSRLGFSFRHANLFDKDHVANIQLLTSPERPNRMIVLGGSYKIPLYHLGDTLEFFGGYSNVNSVVGGLGSFQGGGLLFSARYKHPLGRVGVFDPVVTFGVDLRDYRRIGMTTPAPVTIYNGIVVMPLSLAYAAQGKFAKSDLGIHVAFSANLPGMSKGRAADFATYDVFNVTQPAASYKVVRYGASYTQLIGDDWQFRAAMNGQWSPDVLIQGEQMRLGGADAVRGFSEGSEGGEIGMRWNLEGYTPDFGKGDFRVRALAFFDSGVVQSNDPVRARSSIASAGLGMRAAYAEDLSLRMDAGYIINAGNDPAQRVGDWRAHLGLTASF